MIIEKIPNLYELVTLNPFSKEIINTYQKLLSTDSTDYLQLRSKALAEVDFFSNEFDFKNNKVTKNIQFIFLLHIYSKYINDLNNLIKDQLKQTTPIAVPFINNLIQDFNKFNIPKEKHSHYISMFYQLRRAYFFINLYIKGNNDIILKVKEEIWNCIFTSNLELFNEQLWDKMEDFSLLILGPTGSGKSMIAKIIAYSSYIKFNSETNKFNTPFTYLFKSINLSEYSSSLIESELFGHEKGSFTDAIDSKDGIFENTTSSTCIFLDEIGETPISTQIKLLRVLQDRSFYKVGSTNLLKFNGRVIAATNKTLSELTTPSIFRQDFFFRLSSNIINLPKLNSLLKYSKKENDELVSHICKQTLKINSENIIKSVIKTLTPHLISYKWPGNFRELEQAIRRIILTKSFTTYDHKNSTNEKELSANELLSNYAKNLYEKHKSFAKVAKILDLDNRTVKKYIIK